MYFTLRTWRQYPVSNCMRTQTKAACRSSEVQTKGSPVASAPQLSALQADGESSMGVALSTGSLQAHGNGGAETEGSSDSEEEDYGTSLYAE